MVEAAVLNSTLSAPITLGVAVITFGFVQPAGFTRCGFPITPAAIGVPELVSVLGEEDRWGGGSVTCSGDTASSRGTAR